MKNAMGFTLIELLVVMCIASILGTVGMAGWQRWLEHQRLNDAARQVQLYLLRQRNNAYWYNESRLLSAVYGEQWSLSSGNAPQGCQRVSEGCFRNSWPMIALRSVTNDVGFYGRRNVAKPGRIVIGSAAGERHIIISSRGRVRICRPSAEVCE